MVNIIETNNILNICLNQINYLAFLCHLKLIKLDNTLSTEEHIKTVAKRQHVHFYGFEIVLNVPYIKMLMKWLRHFYSFIKVCERFEIGDVGVEHLDKFSQI